MQLTLLGSAILELHEATNETRGIVMRSLRFEFHPEQVRISSEEILADLRYPAPRSRAPVCESSPALSNGKIYLRSEKHLFCVSEKGVK